MQKEKLAMEKEKLAMEKEKLKMEERIQKEKLEQEEKEKERQYNLRIKELEMQDKAKTKSLDLGTQFDLPNTSDLFLHFKKKELTNIFSTLKKLLKFLNDQKSIGPCFYRAL